MVTLAVMFSAAIVAAVTYLAVSMSAEYKTLQEHLDRENERWRLTHPVKA